MNANKILQNLRKAGKITDIDILEASELDVEMQNCVRAVVLLFGFGSERQAAFYREEQMENCWTLDDHKDWINKTIALMRSLKIESVVELQTVIGLASKMHKESTPPVRRILEALDSQDSFHRLIRGELQLIAEESGGASSIEPQHGP